MIKKLPQAQFQKAVQFIKQNARPLDLAHYKFEFEDGDKTAVYDALSAYQNEDGGFGHGIEPDFRLKASSPMATSVGLQYCIQVNAPDNHPIVQNALRYLAATYNKDDNYWPSTYENVNDEPHAFWWHVKELTPPTEERWPNVSAELAGYVARYATSFPESFVTQVLTRAKQNLAATKTISLLYSLLCWQRAAEEFANPLKSQVVDKIRQTFAAMEPISAKSLQEVGILSVASTVNSIFASQYPEITDQLLDVQITQQTADGGWWPGWEWGQFEKVWPIARKEWAGKITHLSLLALRNFGKIAEA